MKLRTWATEYWLEILLLAIALGNAEVLRQYLTSTGSNDSWQLTIAIYATEVLVATVSMWGIPGLVLALVMFVTSLWSIHQQFDEQWIGHAYFSISIFAGSCANYVRRAEKSRAITKDYQRRAAAAGATVAQEVRFNAKGQLDPAPFAKMSARQLRDVFGLSHRKAKELRRVFLSGGTVTKEWLES